MRAATAAAPNRLEGRLRMVVKAFISFVTLILVDLFGEKKTLEVPVLGSDANECVFDALGDNRIKGSAVHGIFFNGEDMTADLLDIGAAITY
jgi:hypothetical protein